MLLWICSICGMIFFTNFFPLRKKLEKIFVSRKWMQTYYSFTFVFILENNDILTIFLLFFQHHHCVKSVQIRTRKTPYLDIFPTPLSIRISADLTTFTEEILNRKLNFLCSVVHDQWMLFLLGVIQKVRSLRRWWGVFKKRTGGGGS